MIRVRFLGLSSLTLVFFASGCDGGSMLEPDSGDTPELVATAIKGEQVMTPKMVPYKAKGIWWGVPEPAVERDGFDCLALGGLFLDQGAGKINVTHLGKSDYSYINCWGSESIVYQTGIVTGANGDQLYWAGMEGEGMVTLVNWVEGTYEVGPMTISGGTGRFENATGWFMTRGGFQETDGVWTGTEDWTGMISSVGSSK